MGKSPASCFKIISCAGDSVDHDDLQTPESKGSSDRRRWSFRKRSARHRVLSNSVSSETPPSANKENPESPAVSFQVQPDLSVPEKTSIIQLTEEKPELPAQLDSKLSDTIEVVDCKADSTLDEPSVIIIQASIRRLLAQQELLKQKNVIKLQAAVRGHIVRRHAVGTLRCVQSIIKMQALVRAWQADRGKDNIKSTLLYKGKKEAKSNAIYSYTYVSIEKLLGNAFARQLMESTPRTTPINIKCDPSKSDSAWKWLERWMSISSVTKEGPQESESVEEQCKENLVHSDGEEYILGPSECYSESADMTSSVDASVKASENHANLISHQANKLDLYSDKSISSSSSFSNLNDVSQLNSTSDVAESAPVEMRVTESVPEMEETGNELDLPDQPETEAKMLPKKASNPAFITARSKFEELTSAPISTKLPSPPSPLGVEYGLDKAPARSAAQIGSECVTELSISSTPDSPDRSFNGVEQHKIKVPDETEPPKISEEENLELEANNEKSIKRHERLNSAISESLISVNADNSLPPREKKDEAKVDQQIELESEASPRSHITVPESQVTPSSQISVKPKRRSKGKNNKSSSADKARYQDSGTRSSSEHLSDNKNGKRRNSFGSVKVDQNKEHEARDSSTSNSLPSYMQATESARAKAIAANGSPRSSPDVHEKDIYIKTRHSLPGTNERQGSPRIQRSLSQAQQNAKGNLTNSPQDRKWRR